MARSVNDNIEISIVDDGQGIPGHFNAKKGETLGRALVSGLIETQLGGTWDIIGSKGGTKHMLRFKKQNSF